MSLKLAAKSSVKRALRRRTVNVILRRVLRLVSSILPESLTNRIPILGLIDLKLPTAKRLYLESDGNDTIASTIYWKGIYAYESATTRFFMKVLQSAGTVFDIGANTGIYALLAASDNPKRKVYAFEPVPKIFDRLKRNAGLNKLDNLQVYRCAVTNHEGEVKLYMSPGPVPLESSILEGFRNNAKPILVPAMTIDSFVTENKISRVDLLKIDTEATEHLVLEGAKAVLQRDEPMIICEVLWGRTERFLQSLLDNTNYQFFLITDGGLIKKEKIEGDRTYKYNNWFFSTEGQVRALAYSVSIKG